LLASSFLSFHRIHLILIFIQTAGQSISSFKMSLNISIAKLAALGLLVTAPFAAGYVDIESTPTDLVEKRFVVRLTSIILIVLYTYSCSREAMLPKSGLSYLW
jgi:hypothetical protein